MQESTTWIRAEPHATCDPALARPAYETAKRAFDIIFALVLLICALPVFVIAALLVRVTSPGPVIFRQRRCGQGGETFVCYKFRTMVDGSEQLLLQDKNRLQEFARSWKLSDDPRVTPIGRCLRKTSIDELPQLINVLRGDMSIVGPRTVQPLELVEKFGEHAACLVSVKPGLTGLWQVSGRARRTYDERIALELDYIRRRSFWFDLVLVVQTIPAVLSMKGAM
jgi:lipopolysaccharide/colanic/teichoic acid biosynthesis glycosyltransferase